MKKTMSSTFNFNLPFVMLIILTGFFTIMSSCGGGGGGGGGGSGGSGGGGISYTGVTTQAALTAANANKFFATMWYGGTSSSSVSPAPAISKTSPHEYSMKPGNGSFVKSMEESLTGKIVVSYSASQSIERATSVNQTYYGSVSGTLTISGSIDPNTGKGTVTETFTNFNDGTDNTYDGTVTVRIDGFDTTNLIITDCTMTFTLLNIKSDNSYISVTGSIRVLESSDTMTMIVNMDGRDNFSNETFRFANYAETLTLDSIYSPSTISMTFSGQVYAEKFGYVNVSTTSPFICGYTQAAPSSGGPVMLLGAGNTTARVTPVSTLYVRIEVDDNGDSAIECKYTYSWSNINGQPLMPIANGGPNQTVYVGTLVTLDGSGSTDPSGETLTYAWSMTSRPEGSSAVLTSSSAVTTTFVPDIVGTYTASLIVSNQTTSSNPAVIVITANPNPEPVALFAVNGLFLNSDIVLTTTLPTANFLLDNVFTGPASAIYNIGSATSTASPPDMTARNVGLQFAGATEMNILDVWVFSMTGATIDTAVPAYLPNAVAQAFTWAVYTSSDNLTWQLYQTGVPSPYMIDVSNPGVGRFEITFPTVTTKYIKVVVIPLSPSAAGGQAMDFPGIFVTELRAFIFKPAAGV